MLLQKDAKINCSVYPDHHSTDKSSTDNNKRRIIFKFVKRHFEEDDSTDVGKKSYSLFRGIVQNGWLGITYVALDKMERFGVSYARYINDPVFYCSSEL
jgi:hypothetical protein